jgi:hypothetical protein
VGGSGELALFVFVDALGQELAERHRVLEDLLPARGPLNTVFGYSCTCAPTILTGLMPRDHGHLSFFTYDPEHSPFRGMQWLDLLPRAITSRARVRNLMSRAAQRALGYTGYFNLYNVPFRALPLMDYTEKRDLYTPGGINSGAPTVLDRLREAGTPFFVTDWRRGEEANLATAEAELDRGEARFAYLYFAELDGILHAEGTRSPRVARKIAWYEGRLRRLLDRLSRRYSRVRLHLFSDHGMADIRDTCDLIRAVSGTGLEFGKDYAAVYDSTMARFFFLKPGAREKILACLAREPRGRVLSDGELAWLGCDFEDRRYGELFFLLDPGVLLCPSFMGERPIAGMHGYHPSDPDSVAFFGASEAPPSMPRRLDDMHSLMWAQAARAAGSGTAAAA